MATEMSQLVREGIEAYKRGDRDEATRLLTEAIRVDRRDINAWLYLGAVLEEPDRKKQAFEQVLRLDPNNQQAKSALAKMGADTGGGSWRWKFFCR
jgi:Flp pilus assembly protein TadD